MKTKQLLLFKVSQTKREKDLNDLTFEAGKNLASKALIYIKNNNIENYKALLFFHKAYTIISKL